MSEAADKDKTACKPPANSNFVISSAAESAVYGRFCGAEACPERAQRAERKPAFEPAGPPQIFLGALIGRAQAYRLKATTVCVALLIAACIAATSACKHEPANQGAFFPESNEVAGWAKTSATRTFAAADLWKYIDGGAEKYLKAGVRSASTSDYKFQNTLEAVADIYSMTTADGARQVFDSEPIGNANTPQLGDAARLYAQSLVFRKGPYLVRIVSYEESAQAQQALLQLGRAIENRLPQ